MTVHEWASLLVQQVAETDWLQWVAVAAGVAEVLYARAGKIWLYPTGILGTVLTIYILWCSGLYAECWLNGYYFVMSVYGWWHWARKKNTPPVKASYCNAAEWWITGAIVVLGTLLLYVILKYKTPSTVPFWDAWVSATAWAGMWLLARRKIENWILLNISNLFAVPLLFYKHLPMFAALTVFLFVIAVQGFFAWRKEIRADALGTMIPGHS
ncbi:nicotinamide riboside transporter PnuC [Dinghuibacter silviterrae]|uniref:Nicotinamide riboside transporter PnuC n=1 Tax=Dinghuibacter silviterrae TaxID=1539049 RepID=A0A4R8DFU1_9BACT|nr:nicotinamide riboside transporter PnuC [Dinghuibacter silviterrae]TDW95966.1 nicotinamide mononucleotide transporter [Dinghuibacter silviterrae]